MLMLCKVHKAGVMHNMVLDLCHFVMKGKQVFLVDISNALIPNMPIVAAGMMITTDLNARSW